MMGYCEGQMLRLLNVGQLDGIIRGMDKGCMVEQLDDQNVRIVARLDE